MVHTLILASTSVYRRQLLARLQWPFTVEDPQVDETALAHEPPSSLALRLALAKARTVAQRCVGATVIGSDQVANLNGQALGKPGTPANAVAQLWSMQGQRVTFETAVAVVRCGPEAFEGSALHGVHVQFRPLSLEEIEHYLRAEPAYDCAGSAKSEGLGIALLESIETHDPTALMGLPLIDTCRLLRAAGLDPLRPHAPALPNPSTLHRMGASF